MRSTWQQVKINAVKENNGQSIIQAAIPLTKDEIMRYWTPQGIDADIKLNDGRSINHEQRKKTYATIADISDYTGYEPEYMKQLLKLWFCAENDGEDFSLSDCSLEQAREFINFIIEFALMNDIPLSQNAIERTEDISKYLYHCIKYKKCCICGNEGITYTLDQDRNKMSLCNEHYDQAKVKGLKEFSEVWKVYGIQYLE